MSGRPSSLSARRPQRRLAVSRRVFVVVAFGVVLANSAAASAQQANAPALEARWVSRDTVQVTGHGFAPNTTVMIEVDVDEPHASVACYSELTRLALVRDDGTFEVTAHTSPGSGCGFPCPVPAGYVVSASKIWPRAEQLAETRFSCPN
jgi:hypothetical protein